MNLKNQNFTELECERQEVKLKEKESEFAVAYCLCGNKMILDDSGKKWVLYCKSCGERFEI